jgi:K+-sensing histidine kinase KdpD
MSHWLVLTVALGCVFGFAMMKTIRVISENDLLGILAECLSVWYKAQREAHRLPSTKALGTALGTCICGFAAVAVCRFLGGSPYDGLLPLGFVMVILACAWFFGALAGTLGSISAAVVFARFFPPAGLAVADNLARTSLVLMVLSGTVFSWFLAASREHRRMRVANTKRS